jgi:ketosteroid isomerase-like protein
LTRPAPSATSTGMLALLPALLLAATPAPPDVDAVRAADVALDRAVAASDAAAFGALVDDDAVFGGARGLSRGRDAVLAAWKPLLAPGGPKLRWAPRRAGVASSGDLAFTTGRWTLETAGKDGKPVRDEGEYVTVWRRGPGGRWRALLDASLRPPPRKGDGVPVQTPVLSATSSAGDLDAVIGTWTRGVDEGGYLVLRRRKPAGGWQILVESAFPFRRPTAG